MPPLNLWLGFVVASLLLAAIPCPSLLFVIGRALVVALQMAVLGLTFFVVGVTSDGLVAMAAGSARAWLASRPQRLRRLSAAGGVMMILLGVTLMLTGRPQSAAVG